MMNKRLLLAVTIATILGMGCSGTELEPIGPTSTPAAITAAPTTTAPTAPAPTATPAGTSRLRSTRDGVTPNTSDVGGVKVTLLTMKVADFSEYVQAADQQSKGLLATKTAEGIVTIGQIEVRVENATAGKLSLYPDQGTVVVGNEQVDVDLLLSGEIGGDYFPGVVKEAKVFFFLKRTAAVDVREVLYSVDAPFSTETFRRLGADYLIRVPF